MSKEWLEQLRDWRNNLTETLVLTELDDDLKTNTRNYRDLLSYAIDQGERVQELEHLYYDLLKKNTQRIKDHEECRQDVIYLYKQNKRYRNFFGKIKAMLKDADMECGMIIVELREMCKSLEVKDE